MEDKEEEDQEALHGTLRWGMRQGPREVPGYCRPHLLAQGSKTAAGGPEAARAAC